SGATENASPLPLQSSPCFISARREELCHRLRVVMSASAGRGHSACIGSGWRAHYRSPAPQQDEAVAGAYSGKRKQRQNGACFTAIVVQLPLSPSHQGRRPSL